MSKPQTPDYKDFVINKSHIAKQHVFSPTHVNPMAYDFQNYAVEFACQTGRSAAFAGCGLGKSLIGLAFAQNVIEHTNKPVLHISPLSVSVQMLEEAEKFGYDAERSKDGKFKKKIVTTNYERLHHFNPDDFAGIICDESSILKNFKGRVKHFVTHAMRKVDYRLLSSATQSPNNYTEFGTATEALGVMGYMDMLSTFFKNNDGDFHPGFTNQQWRFKPHAENDFWRFLASWAIAISKPSDLGFDDRDFILPELIENTHVLPSELNGELYAQICNGMSEERVESKNTLKQRCEKAAEISITKDVSINWVNLNPEGDLITQLIPNAVQLKGPQSDEEKIEILSAFKSGEITNLVTKPKIAAFGMNWQHCNHMTHFPTHSFEQKHQAVRRCWRFGQKQPVTVDTITTDKLIGITRNLKTKEDACAKMYENLVREMNNAKEFKIFRNHNKEMSLPSWL